MYYYYWQRDKNHFIFFFFKSFNASFCLNAVDATHSAAVAPENVRFPFEHRLFVDLSVCLCVCRRRRRRRANKSSTCLSCSHCCSLLLTDHTHTNTQSISQSAVGNFSNFIIDFDLKSHTLETHSAHISTHTHTHHIFWFLFFSFFLPFIGV